MKAKTLIKDKYKDGERYSYYGEVIYNSATSDYFITQEESGEIFLYGSNKRLLTPFLIPGIKTTVSVENGNFICTDEIFSGIKDIFQIEEDEHYYILAIKDNSNSDVSTVLLFNTVEDCLNTQGFLTYLSTTTKLAHLKEKL